MRLLLSSTSSQTRLLEGERLFHYGLRLGWEAGHLLSHVHSRQKGPGGDYGIFTNSLSVRTKVSFSPGAYDIILLYTLDAFYCLELIEVEANHYNFFLVNARTKHSSSDGVSLRNKTQLIKMSS